MPTELESEATSARRQEFENILPQVLPRWRRIAARWLDNHADAEDAVQDAVVSAFTHIAQFEGRAKLSTWLSTIVINAVRMQMRHRRRGRMFSLDYAPKEGQQPISQLLADPRPTPEKVLEQFELYTLVIKLTSGLAPSQRTAFRLYHQNGHSIRKLAKNSGVPEGTLKAQLARGRANLKGRLREIVGKPKVPVTVPTRRAACPRLIAMRAATRQMMF